MCPKGIFIFIFITNYLQKPRKYAVGDDNSLLFITAHDGILNEIERLIAFCVILSVQVVDVITRRFSIHDEYRMRNHNNDNNDDSNNVLIIVVVIWCLSSSSVRAAIVNVSL